MSGFEQPYGFQRLIAFFLAWKAFLLVVAYASPAPGYDTSTQILFDQSGPRAHSWIEEVVLRLSRWDAIYFATLAERGHVNEQDWAFSWALARVNDGMAKSAYATKRYGLENHG